MSDKPCSTCRWFEREQFDDVEVYQCWNPNVGPDYISRQRRWGRLLSKLLWVCGRAGRWWEPRELLTEGRR